MEKVGKVLDMDDANFRLFIRVMETMEKEDSDHSNLESAIIKILDKFEDVLTDEQKVIIMREFSKYENLRKKKKKEKEAKDDEEKYQQMVDDFRQSAVESHE